MRHESIQGYARRSEFYKVEYQERRDVAFWLSQLSSGEEDILEIPCGVGRLTLDLAPRARHVTAVDIEPRMVEILRERASRRGLSKKIDAVVADLTTLELNSAFDLIVVPREALQLLPPADASKALSQLSRHLQWRGRLIVDLATFAEGCSGDPDYFDADAIGESWTPQWTRGLENGGALTRSVRIRRFADRHHFTFRYEVVSDGNERRVFEDDMVLYQYDAAWLSRHTPQDMNLQLSCSTHHELYPCNPGGRLIATFTAIE
jgi:SAM-dependent methyltransferase